MEKLRSLIALISLIALCMHTLRYSLGHGERSGQGQVCWGMPGHARACWDMSRPRVLQTRPGDRPATKPTNQEPTRSPHRPIRSWHGALGHQSPLSPRPRRLPLLHRPPSLPCLPAPGSSAGERPPNKRPWSTVYRGGSFFPWRFLHMARVWFTCMSFTPKALAAAALGLHWSNIMIMLCEVM